MKPLGDKMSLADHINNNDLRNHELNALAKVRFIDEETQLALAKQPYRRAKMHLASNENRNDTMTFSVATVGDEATGDC
jgi:hypothetical protein